MSGSKATSQKCAPKEWIAYCFWAASASVFARPSNPASFCNTRICWKGTPLSDDLSCRCTRPWLIFKVLGSACANGDPDAFDAALSRAVTALSVALGRGGSTLAVAAEPPDVGHGGRELSPRMTFTFSTGIPVLSDTTSAKTV